MKAVVVDSKIIDLFPDFNIEKEILAAAGIELAVENITNQEDYVRLCRDAEALLLIGRQTPREVIEQLPACRAIIRYGVGVDAVDVAACSERGIVVCNVPDAGTYEVGSHAFALALDCLRKITCYDRQIRKGNWHAGSGYTIRRFTDYTFGYCGFGNIGRAAARFAGLLDCRLIAYDPYVRDEVFAAAGVARVTFAELLAQADVISIHTPLNPKTHRLFAKEQFQTMKPGMILINTSRGGLVDRDALMDAIDAGIVAAAGLDVHEHEPLTDLNDRIFQYDTVILTPHSATESTAYAPTLQEHVARTAVAVLGGELPANVINREAILKFRQKV